MTTATLFALLIVWIAAIVSPGPDLVQIIRLGSRSRGDGIWAALGIMVGNTIWICASLLGLSVLISTTPLVLWILQLIGGAYLTWMGIGAVRSWWKQRVHTQQVARAVERVMEGPGVAGSIGAWPALRTGIATNLSNPKAVLFFGSVFAQFITPDMSLGWSVFLALFLIITGVLWFVGFAVLVRTFATVVTRNGAVIDLITGVIFIALGMFMVWQGVVGIGGWILG
ncbi:Threonine efflux protein [Corynebacterium faecale]|uniref:LysE family translocator n=1 Tax=Corynebacterium faecale TaxID=1758466 RepID=UPI0025B3EBB9|nr:LysE family translocator [Corynebacterium faecale]WJY90999.1 Threonine efflux protein [Corynebacterium faecale]